MTENLPRSVKILRVEDGFLRSTGLGADLTRPLSWVLDDKGIYYDSRQPSRLEYILQNNNYDATLLGRARDLREKILSTGVTKYNIVGKVWFRPPVASQVILVPGQVENDASLRFGAPKIKTNIELLQNVRRDFPHAYVVYKPHPDVVAGLRRSGRGDGQVSSYCDEIVKDADPAQMLSQVDQVHTMTSLLGFEALLRGIPVTCYGQPFYCGWGLTQDVDPLARRTRKLSIDALVAGVLIKYPQYVSLRSNRFTTPEKAIDELATSRQLSPARSTVRKRILRGILVLWARSGLKKDA